MSSSSKDQDPLEGGDPNPGIPSSPEGSIGGVSSTEEEDMVERARSASGSEEELIPIPPPVPKSGISILTHKLWIGNLDKRLNEQNILRFTSKYGTIVSFRYLFKTGPERPEQRDYVFVEYSTREEAERAKGALHGKKALGKRIIVDWARQDQGAAKKNQQHAVSETWDASSVSETLNRTASTSAKIAALEAKLKQMEEGGAPAPKKQKLGTTFSSALSSTLKLQQPKRRTENTSKLNLPHRQMPNKQRNPPARTFLPLKH